MKLQIEKRKLRDRFGLTYGSLSALEINARQLGRDGLSRDQLVKALQNLHPKLMENLAITVTDVLVAIDPSMRWERNNGWR